MTRLGFSFEKLLVFAFQWSTRDFKTAVGIKEDIRRRYLLPASPIAKAYSCFCKHKLIKQQVPLLIITLKDNVSISSCVLHFHSLGNAILFDQIKMLSS